MPAASCGRPTPRDMPTTLVLGYDGSDTGKKALAKAIQKLPIKARIITREETY